MSSHRSISGLQCPDGLPRLAPPGGRQIEIRTQTLTRRSGRGLDRQHKSRSDPFFRLLEPIGNQRLTDANLVSESELAPRYSNRLFERLVADSVLP
jgi:hypothetical protein